MPRLSPQRRLPTAAIQQRFILTPQHLRWVEEYLLTLDPDAASARTGLTREDGRRLLATRRVQDAISLASRRALTHQQVYLEDVLRNLVLLRDADPNELVEVRRVNCRFCNGIDHDHQFNDVEYRRALTVHRREMQELVAQGAPQDDPRLVPFDERGGPGFRVNAPPHQDCPACDGDGDLRIIVKDTRTLSQGARLLYDGVKVGAGGSVEIKFRDRAAAEDRLLRYAGAFNDRRTPSDPNRVRDEQLVDAVMTLVEHGAVEIEHLPLGDPADDETDVA